MTVRETVGYAGTSPLQSKGDEAEGAKGQGHTPCVGGAGLCGGPSGVSSLGPASSPMKDGSVPADPRADPSTDLGHPRPSHSGAGVCPQQV